MIHSVKKIPFYLITGFLGSGKTTLIKHFIEENGDAKRVAIVQNEFSEVNFDGRELKGTGKSFQLLEINNGSVFCVCLLGGFIQSLTDFIHQHQPDMIILEASGLADPISLGQVVSSSALRNLIWLAHTYTMVDVSNFQRTIDRIPRNLHQIRVADTLVLNKCDLSNDSLPEIRSKLLQINPFAKIVETTFGKVKLSSIAVFHPPVGLENRSDFQPSGRPDVDSVVIKTTKSISSENLDKFLAKYCLISYRIKGYVLTTKGSVAIQSSFEHVELKVDQNNPYFTEFVIIGLNLEQKILQKEFDKLCR